MGRRLQFRNAVLRHLAAPSLAILLGIGSAAAQSGDLHPQDQGKPAATAPTDAAKNGGQNQRKTDEYAQAAQVINGPAGNRECVWIGRRIVGLIFRDDLDTAFRHLELYDRFGCPGGHIQAAFRCLTRFVDEIDDKVPEKSLNGRVYACWINPATEPQVAAAAPATSASPTPEPSPAASNNPSPPPPK